MGAQAPPHTYSPKRHFSKAIRLDKDWEGAVSQSENMSTKGWSPLICCGTSPLRCSAKLSWVKTATELMAGLGPTHNPGELLKQEGRSEAESRHSQPVRLRVLAKGLILFHQQTTPFSSLTSSDTR